MFSITKTITLIIIVFISTIITGCSLPEEGWNNKPDKVSVLVYFQSGTDCSNIQGLYRYLETDKLINSPAQDFLLEKLTIKALFEGPNPDEKLEGFNSNLKISAILTNYVSANGVVELTFSDQFYDSQSICGENTAKEQIIQTLKQFPGVKMVKINNN